MSAPPQTSADTAVLCVDLDGTLIRTDTFVEGLFRLVRVQWWCLFLVPIWLLRGRAYTKQQIGRRVKLDVSVLPYRNELVEFLRAQKTAGRKLVLVTGSDEIVAREVAGRLALFDEVLTSNGHTNMIGRHKASTLVARFGSGGFDYVGDSTVDRPVWSAARRCYYAGRCPNLEAELRSTGKLERSFREPVSLAGWIRTLRPHQWMKNLLLFVPLFTAQKWREGPLLLKAFWAFGTMGLLASSAYVLNDLLDAENDRHHEAKRDRPLASGEISMPWAFTVSLLLMLTGLAAASTLGRNFVGYALFYYVATVLYSTLFRSIVLLDVFVLAGLYTLRILIGGAALDIVISSWLLAFAGFYFLSLAFLKRYSELHALPAGGGGQMRGRDYSTVDMEHVALSGAAGGYVAVLVFVLYINNPDVRILYSHPSVLWFCCPLLLYWNNRLWLLAARGQMNSDPVLFAVRDRVSYLVGLIILIIIMMAR